MATADELVRASNDGLRQMQALSPHFQNELRSEQT